MLTDKRFPDAYADLLDEQVDPALVADLDSLHHPVPPAQLRAAIAQSIAQRAATMPRRSPVARRWNRLFPPTPRLAAVLVALLAFTMLAAAAAPLVTSIVDQAFGMAAGTNRIVTQHLGKELGVSQTVNGFTVTIERVYADANQIVIGYSVSGPPDRTFNNFLAFGAQRGQTPMLVDDTGREFQHSPIGWGAGVEAGKGGYLLLYDAAPLGGNPAELNVHLTIGSLDVIERVNGGTQTVAGAAARPTAQKGGDAGPYCGPEVCIYSVAGPFTFDFTVPFAASRVAEPHQTIKVGGLPVTLDRFSATPTGTWSRCVALAWRRPSRLLAATRSTPSANSAPSRRSAPPTSLSTTPRPMYSPTISANGPSPSPQRTATFQVMLP
ncbi:MAG: DUF4179 domain-containing protein [Chloroflexia bacterium]